MLFPCALVHMRDVVTDTLELPWTSSWAHLRAHKKCTQAHEISSLIRSPACLKKFLRNSHKVSFVEHGSPMHGGGASDSSSLIRSPACLKKFLRNSHKLSFVEH